MSSGAGKGHCLCPGAEASQLDADELEGFCHQQALPDCQETGNRAGRCAQEAAPDADHDGTLAHLPAGEKLSNQ